MDMIAYAENEPLYIQSKTPGIDMTSHTVFPHKSAEKRPNPKFGGRTPKTMGFGHLFMNPHVESVFDKHGTSLKGAVDLLKSDIERRGFKAAERSIDSKFGAGTFAKLDPLAKEMAADIQFQTGNVATGWKDFTKFIMKGDLRAAIPEMMLSTTQAQDKDMRDGLIRRNKIRSEYWDRRVSAWEAEREKQRQAVLKSLASQNSTTPKQGAK